MMVYFDMLEPVRQLSDVDRGRLFLAMLEYGKNGVEPTFRGKLGITWGFVKPRLDRDVGYYENSKSQRRYAAFCKKRLALGREKVPFEDWSEMTEEERKQALAERAVVPVAARDPYTDTNTISDTDTYTNSNTKSNTKSNTAAAAGPKGRTATAAQRELKKMGGMLGKGVVLLSDDQIDDLLDQMGLDAFDHYVEKLAEFIVTRDARVKGHYETILRWWRKDMGLER